MKSENLENIIKKNVRKKLFYYEKSLNLNKKNYFFYEPQKVS